MAAKKKAPARKKPRKSAVRKSQDTLIAAEYARLDREIAKKRGSLKGLAESARRTPAKQASPLFVSYVQKCLRGRGALVTCVRLERKLIQKSPTFIAFTQKCVKGVGNEVSTSDSCVHLVKKINQEVRVAAKQRKAR